MSYTVSVNHPHLPEDTEFGIGALGTIPNGSSKEIDEDEERAFMMARGLPLDQAFSGDATVEVTGSSALDKSEIDQIMEFFAPEEEEEETRKEEAANEDRPAAGRSVFTPPAPKTDETADTGTIAGGES